MSITNKRWDLISRFSTILRRIQTGAAVGGSSPQTYSVTVGYIGYGYLDETNYANSEMPAVLVIPDQSSRFNANGDGTSYEADMFIGLQLVVKDEEKRDIRNTQILSKLEELFRNVDLAMHVEHNLNDAADVGIILESWDSGPSADPDFGHGVALYRVAYQHMAF